MTNVSEETAVIFKTKDSALNMEVTYYSEMLVNLGQTERRQIPEAQSTWAPTVQKGLRSQHQLNCVRLPSGVCECLQDQPRITLTEKCNGIISENAPKFRSHSPCCSRDILAAIDGLCALNMRDSPQDDRQVSPSANDYEIFLTSI